MWCQPRNPLPPSPFCLPAHGSNSCDCVDRHLSKLSSYSFPFCAQPPNFPPSLISSLCGLGFLRLNVHSPFYLFFAHGSSSSQLNSHSPFCLLFVHGLGSPNMTFAPPFVFSLNTNETPPNSISIHIYVASPWAWSSSMCTNLLQVGKAQFQRLKGVWTSLVRTSCSSFFATKGVPNLMFGSFILMSLC
jgi:hypothetical protein